MRETGDKIIRSLENFTIYDGYVLIYERSNLVVIKERFYERFMIYS